LLTFYRSQCSTVVRNTGAMATIKVTGKPQIWGTRSSQTAKSIDLKFDLSALRRRCDFTCQK